MTVPQRMLWQRLRLRPSGLRFRRQHPVGPYVVDFCVLARRFVVEVDGSAHDQIDRTKFDERRVALLKENGFRVMRVAAVRVLADADTAAEAIVARAASPHHQPAAGPAVPSERLRLPRAGEAA